MSFIFIMFMDFFLDVIIETTRQNTKNNLKRIRIIGSFSGGKKIQMKICLLVFSLFFFVESCSTNSETNVTMVEVINHRRRAFILQNSAKNQQSP